MTEEYLPVAECQRGHIYRLRSRNLSFGVFAPEKENGFIGIREKFGSLFLFTEHHWDNGPPHGTARPVEALGPLEDDNICLVETMPTVCGYCGERLDYLLVEGGIEKGDYLCPGEWRHLTGDGSCPKACPESPRNAKLYRALEAVERERGEGASRRMTRPDACSADVVSSIDELIDSILERPPMHGVDEPQGLEAQVRTLLGLRDRWAPQPAAMVPWKTVYGRWIAEYFDEKPGADNRAAFSRLIEKFGWKEGTTCQAEANETSWPEIVEFYRELVRRERCAAEGS